MTFENAIAGIGLLTMMGLPISVEAADSKSITLKQIGRYSAGASTVPDEPRTEIAAYDPASNRLFDTRSDNKVYDISRPTAPKFVTYVNTAPTDLTPEGLLFIKKHALGTADGTTPITDTWLTAKTKIALFANARIKGSEISVEASRGAVIIRGKVDSDKARQTAEGIAKEIPGVTSVKNNLQVMAPSIREVIDDKDEAITTRVAEQIEKDSQLKQAGILVQTFAGVVSLSGEISDIVTSAHASWATWQVPGVKLVKNELRVKEKG
ncbi:MAG: BON domain-containing protein [Nitrospiraceae bacterium]|nr:BON domain-containing protein [Nitrospiraceae bacterium]